MKRELLKVASIVVTALLLTSMLFGLRIFPVEAVALTTFRIIDPGPNGYPAKWTASEPDPGCVGTEHFNFSGDQFDKTFFINVTIETPPDAAVNGWAIGIVYDNSTLEYVSAWRPTDHIFKPVEEMGWTIIAPSVTFLDVDATHKLLMWGCTYIMGTPEWTFNGTGTMAQIQFKIIKSVARLNPIVTAVFTWDTAWTKVYFYPSGMEIPNLYLGYVKITWIVPPPPFFYTKPSVYKAAVKGGDVAIEVWIKDVDAGWSIIGIQFALWFNTAFLEARTYEAGTWIDTFANNGETTLKFAYNDFHDVMPPEYYCYNKWFCGVVILPDPVSGFVPPFPSGEGMLFRLHFTAVSETIFPEESWTTLQLKEMEVYDMYAKPVPVGLPYHCLYRAPVKTLGLDIDVFTQYTYPFGGQGKHNPSDMFGPQAEVILSARVVYNEYPVQMKPVAFEIRHGEFYIYREDYTDEDGIAMVAVRLPWPCVDPVGRVFGEWEVIATVEVAERRANDTLKFKVWWLVEITSVKSTQDSYKQTKPPTSVMEFLVEYRTYRMQTIPVVLTVTVYDELGFFIGSAIFDTIVGWGEYDHYCQFINYTHTFTIPLPTHAVVGVATVYANAYDNVPWNLGVPYCPEVSDAFYITK